VSTTDQDAVTILSVVVVLVPLIVRQRRQSASLAGCDEGERDQRALSMGATRARLIRQLLTESLLLASIGGGLGILVAQWGNQLLPGNAGHPMPLDWRVLAFVLGVSVLTGVVFGIAPALRATGLNISAALKENSRPVAGPGASPADRCRASSRDFAGALIAAGPFLRTLHNLRNVDVGFNTTMFRVNPGLNCMTTPA
jgi:hypothetical protein